MATKREYRFTNSAAQKLPLEELLQELHDCFVERNGREPSDGEKIGLREAAEWIKGNNAPWRKFEQGIHDQTWDPTDGARSIFSSPG
jgi:hypothetical protein